ncbi:MAG: hypothetical protein CM1200mP24_05680 [Gammaproteobacteria bacterium]|nr:MAG: hypothetical protein CM1200mP24_05680 [Gammaproteobacteria bacterium]
MRYAEWLFGRRTNGGSGINKVMLMVIWVGILKAVHTGREAVARFSIATSDSWRDRNTQEMQERTEWHNVVCFARLAEMQGNI